MISFFVWNRSLNFPIFCRGSASYPQSMISKYFLMIISSRHRQWEDHHSSNHLKRRWRNGRRSWSWCRVSLYYLIYNFMSYYYTLIRHHLLLPGCRYTWPVAQSTSNMALSGAYLQLCWHHCSDARGGQEVCHCWHLLEGHHGRSYQGSTAVCGHLSVISHVMTIIICNFVFRTHTVSLLQHSQICWKD